MSLRWYAFLGAACGVGVTVTLIALTQVLHSHLPWYLFLVTVGYPTSYTCDLLASLRWVEPGNWPAVFAIALAYSVLEGAIVGILLGLWRRSRQLP